MLIGENIIRYEKVSSTNTVALEMIRKGVVQEGTVIIADYQETGRGQTGNMWESENGKNLLMSVILYPVMVSPSRQFLLSEAISLAVCDLVSRESDGAAIKWPNDIYAGNDKIAGILIENSIMADRIGSSITGIGLNINQTVFRSNAPNPVSLKILTGKDYDISRITSDLCSNIGRRYEMIIRGLAEELSEEYNERLFRRNSMHRYNDTEGEFSGIITGVTENGMLQLRKSNGTTREYSFREIDYIL